MAKHPPDQILKGRKDAVAQSLRSGANLDRILVDQLGWESAELPNLRRGFAQTVREDDQLAEALEARIEEIVKQNQEVRLSNTSIGALSRQLRMNPNGLTSFISSRGIELKPLGDDTLAGERRRKEVANLYAQGATLKDLRVRFGVEDRTIKVWVRSEGESVREWKSIRYNSDLQNSVLLLIVNGTPQAGRYVFTTAQVIDAYPDLPVKDSRKKRVVEDLRVEIIARCQAVLDAIRRESKGKRIELRNQLKEMADEGDEDTLLLRRLIRLSLEDDRAVGEERAIKVVQRGIDKEFFDSQSFCPPWFAERMIRLAAFNQLHHLFSSRVVTPQSLDEVRAQLQEWMDASYGPGKKRLRDMTSQCVSQGIPEFDRLLKRVFPGSSAVERSEIASELLAGTPRSLARKRDYSERKVRWSSVNDILDRSGGEAAEVYPSRFMEYDALYNYYRELGAESFREGCVWGMREFRLINRVQERIIMARERKIGQQELVLKYHQPNIAVGDYNAHLRSRNFKPLVLELERDLARAIDRNEDPQQIALRYSVGARGVRKLISIFEEGANRRADGRLQLVAFGRETDRASLIENEDMLSLYDLGRRLEVDHLWLSGRKHFLQVRVGQKLRLSPGLRAIRDPLEILTSACLSDDIDVAEGVVSKLQEAISIAAAEPVENRNLISGSGSTRQPFADRRLELLRSNLEHIQDELTYWEGIF